MKNSIFAVIMAGGSGIRFWPKSRKNLPKQFLKIIGDKTMIQATVNRIESLVSYKNILIVTNVNHAKTVHDQLPSISSANVILEPVARNTAPCIGLAALTVQQRDKNGVMLVLPSDHWINDDRQFCLELEIAAERAVEKETLILFGIKPSYPETGYGYVQRGKNINPNPSSDCKIYQIEKFKEKPDVEQAKEFIKSGNFYWNSGSFAWKASVILDEIKNHLPDLHNGLMKIKAILDTTKDQVEINKIFQTLRPESIDTGVMEKTNRAEIIISQVGWGDVGSWKALENHLPTDTSGNAASKKHILIDTKNSIIEGDNRMIAAIGLKDMVVIDTEDVLLICPKERCQEIKNLVGQLKKEGKDEYL